MGREELDPEAKKQFSSNIKNCQIEKDSKPIIFSECCSLVLCESKEKNMVSFYIQKLNRKAMVNVQKGGGK